MYMSNIDRKHITDKVILSLMFSFTRFQEPKRISQAGLHPGGIKREKSLQEYCVG